MLWIWNVLILLVYTVIQSSHRIAFESLISASVVSDLYSLTSLEFEFCSSTAFETTFWLITNPFSLIKNTLLLILIALTVTIEVVKTNQIAQWYNWKPSNTEFSFYHPTPLLSEFLCMPFWVHKWGICILRYVNEST